MITSCCLDIVGARNVENPFAEMIGLGYYDGPTSGVARCGKCGAEYRFAMFDWSEDKHEHDETDQTRVGGLFALNKGTCEAISALVPRSEKLKGRVWVPTVDPILGKKIDRIVDEGTGELLIVMAWNPSFETIITAKKWDEPLSKVEFDCVETRTDPPRDWFSFLGLKR